MGERRIPSKITMPATTDSTHRITIVWKSRVLGGEVRFFGRIG
jgi:hypothetical protein